MDVDHWRDGIGDVGAYCGGWYDLFAVYPFGSAYCTDLESRFDFVVELCGDVGVGIVYHQH